MSRGRHLFWNGEAFIPGCYKIGRPRHAVTLPCWDEALTDAEFHDTEAILNQPILDSGLSPQLIMAFIVVAAHIRVAQSMFRMGEYAAAERRLAGVGLTLRSRKRFLLGGW